MSAAYYSGISSFLIDFTMGGWVTNRPTGEEFGYCPVSVIWKWHFWVSYISNISHRNRTEGPADFSQYQRTWPRVLLSPHAVWVTRGICDSGYSLHIKERLGSLLWPDFGLSGSTVWDLGWCISGFIFLHANNIAKLFSELTWIRQVEY